MNRNKVSATKSARSQTARNPKSKTENPKSLDLICGRHEIRRPILPRQHRTGFLIASKRFRLRIKRQRCSELNRRLRQVDLVVGQVPVESLERLIQIVLA